MNINTIAHHPRFPTCVWVVIEQPRFEPLRYVYEPTSQTFHRSEYNSLLYARGFSGAYGWIGGTGTPPAPHFDVMLFTQQTPKPGDIIDGYLCGMFKRGDGDHKFVALDLALCSETEIWPDLFDLEPALFQELMLLYPEIGPGEGWTGAKEAQLYLQHNQPTHD